MMASFEKASFPWQPATVSRCGMIYMEPSQLGWEPLVISWMNTLPEILKSPDHNRMLLELFHWLLPPSFKMVRNHCRVSITGPWLYRDAKTPKAKGVVTYLE